MVKFVETKSTDERFFVFKEKHISGGNSIVLITGKQIVKFMRIMTKKPFDCIHENWINEFCEMYNAELVCNDFNLYKYIYENTKKISNKDESIFPESTDIGC